MEFRYTSAAGAVMILISFHDAAEEAVELFVKVATAMAEVALHSPDGTPLSGQSRL